MSNQSTPNLLTPLMTPADLAARWGLSVSHLANERWRGSGPVYLKVGGRVLYRVSDIMAYEDAGEVRPVAAA